MTNPVCCPICGSASSLVSSVPTINPDADDQVDLMECSRCDHWFNPFFSTQDDLSKLYEESSPYVVGSDFRCDRSRMDNEENPFHRYIRGCGSNFVLKRNAAYLEIGVGSGELFRKFRELGYVCYGVDPGHRIEDENVYASLAGIPANLTFDVFVLKDVLEHVLDPVDMMKTIRRVAKNDAVVYCSFPCKDSRPARLNRHKWPMIRPYGHLHYFSFRSAGALFEKSGWSVKNQKLASTYPLLKICRRLDIRQLAYEMLKGGRDQLYVMAVPGRMGPVTDSDYRGR